MPTKPHACLGMYQLLTPAKAFAFLDTDHDGIVSVDEIAAQMQSVMRVTVPADEIRSICKVSLSKNPKGLTMEDFTYLVCTLPTVSTPQFRSECARAAAGALETRSGGGGGCSGRGARGLVG